MRLHTQSGAARSFVLYEWLTGPEFLIRAVVPDAAVVTASIHDTAERVLSELPKDAAVFLFHLNCTKTRQFPLARAELVAALKDRGVRILNETVTDVSKRAIQASCAALGLNTCAASRDGDENELMIVKTNLNFAGASEWGLTEAERGLLGVGKGSQSMWDPYHYMVLPRGKVDSSCWTDNDLVCERYISNEYDRWYRAYLFLGRVVVCEYVSTLEVKKVGESRLQRVWMCAIEGDLIRRFCDDDYPELLLRDLATFVQERRLDFGTVDLVQDRERNYYIIDVNTTPAYNSPVKGLTEHLK